MGASTDVRCPDCVEAIPVPPAARPGDLLECGSCASHALRLAREGGRWVATLAPRLSCPSCDEILTLPAEAKAGDPVECCGRRYRLTYEYGAFAAEEASEARMWRDRWFALALVGTILTCLACVTPVAVLALGAIGLGAWTGHLDAVLILLLVGFGALAVYRYVVARRRTP